ncbi:MAG: family 78 glycoside hydrolase catalytic domain [Dysgonamonadaceae bacterium]|nr:family 78 glycoside hydrolase catalytic domain [Dysgonamonadaceae bacterium]
MKKLVSILFVMAVLNTGCLGQSLKVVNPRCEYMTDPVGISVLNPRFSWELESEEPNKRQTAYRISVDTDEKFLSENKWSSGIVRSGETNQIKYHGPALKANTIYYWKVTVWDETNRESGSSKVSRIFTGPDWDSNPKALWIGEKTTEAPYENKYYPSSGYTSEYSETENENKWIVIDLGKVTNIDAVKMYPVKNKEKIFPVRFTIEISSDNNFNNASKIIDETENDVSVNSGTFYHKRLIKPVSARYVKFNIIKLAKDEKDSKEKFGIAEIEIHQNSENIALNAAVETSDTTSLDRKWEQKRLTDGYKTASNLPKYSDKIPPSPLLRKEIKTVKKHKSAFWSVSAQGVYEAYINGQKVGNRYLAPEFTDYDSHLQFQTYDVTNLIREGENALGAMLADGWFAGARWSHPNRGGYGLFRKFIGRLVINYGDGTTESIVTDGSWKICEQGPIREASLFIGEVYDASYEKAGWNLPGYDDSLWKTVSVYKDEKWNLVSQLNEPIKAVEEITAISVHKVGKNKYIFDIGQNIPGWVRLNIPYNPNNTIRLRYGECLYEDGTLYTENLREAKQIDVYQPHNEKKIVYEPRFTYHGFRYVEVDGLTKEPQKENVVGIAIASSSPIKSNFECSNKDLNKLWSNIRWTLWGNLISIPTDCPQRDEREGWMADAQIFSQTAIYNLDMAGFYTKWVRDIRDSQLEDGRYPDIAPHDGTWRNFFAAPGWADAGTVIPWRVYQNYNDIDILDKNYESMKKWVDFVHKYNPQLTWENNLANSYNDWLNGNWINSLDDYPKNRGSVPKEVFATAYFAKSAEIVAQSAKLLGHKSDFKKYAALANGIREAFVRNYVSSEGKIKGETQAGYAIALQFDILPEHLRKQAAKWMVEAVKDYDFRISTGIHGTVMLMEQLSRYGYGDISWRLLTSHRFPSWLYSIDQGATTIWERWDGYVAGRGFQDAGMNSMNHVAIGAVGQWLYRHILGIQLDPNSQGYRHFIIKPDPGENLRWARGNYHSINGNIEVNWMKKDGKFELNVTVPANTTATVILPDGTERKIKSGKYNYKVTI